MKTAYEESAKFYKALVTRIKKENTAVVDQLMVRRIPQRQLRPMRDRSVFQYIRPDPKTNFLSIAPISLFTKDDPILRYVPSIRSTQPASINWYEGTVIGDRPMNARDTTGLIFFCHRGHKTADKIAFIRQLGQTGAAWLPPEARPRRMADLFCAVCCMFDCGIHASTSHTVLKFNEESRCICHGAENAPLASRKGSLRNTLHIKGTKPKAGASGGNFDADACMDSIPTNTLDCMNGTPANAPGSIDSTRTNRLKRHGFKSCVTAKILEIKFKMKANCQTIKSKKHPIKKCAVGKRSIDPREFYEPCSHAGSCSMANCRCVQHRTACEFACGCSSCSNSRYCACTVCTETCPCLANHRECAELCGCEKHASSCCNRNARNRVSAELSISQSQRHGYGLFAECFIKSGSFVIEYTGEIISDKEAERRGNFYEMNRCSYLFNLVNQNDDCLYSVDAFFLGNKSRYINHSAANANLKAEVLLTSGFARIVFYSIKDIYKGEELLFDYHFSETHKEKHGIIDF